MESPVIPRHPLDHPGVVKILLSRAASEALEAIGPHCLCIATKADCTAPPEAQGRMILHCLPITKEAADGAYRVVSGTHRATRIKAAKLA